MLHQPLGDTLLFKLLSDELAGHYAYTTNKQRNKFIYTGEKLQYVHCVAGCPVSCEKSLVKIQLVIKHHGILER